MIDMEKKYWKSILEIEYVLIAYPYIRSEKRELYVWVYMCKLILVERMCRCPFEVHHAAGILTNLFTRSAKFSVYCCDGVVIPI